MATTLAAFLLVSTVVPGAPDAVAVVESWTSPTVAEFASCADLARQQNELFDYLYETGLSSLKSQGGRQKARCEVAFAEERVADINVTRFNKAMTAPEMVPVKF